MLREVHIENFALLEKLDLTFDSGFNVLTGETGAGKSIIIDAVAVLLGGRASVDSIRSGASSSVIEALFEVGRNSSAFAALEEMGLLVEDDSEAVEVIVTREISLSGRNRCRVNGRAATREMLAELGAHLVDICGQHEHQSLTRQSVQLRLLDAFAGPEVLGLRRRVESLYAQWRETREELEQLAQNEAQRAQREDMLRYQVAEIAGAGLSAGEDESLERERILLLNGERLLALLGRAYDAIYGAGEGEAALVQAGSAASALVELSRLDPHFEALRESVQTAVYQLEEAARELSAYRDGVDLDPDRLNVVQERLDLISRLKRKYGATVSDVLAHADLAAQELTTLSSSEERHAGLAQRVEGQQAELAQAVAALSERRATAAKAFSQATASLLADLNMTKARFEVRLSRSAAADNAEAGLPVGNSKVKVGPTGVDQCEFLFQANPGEELRPMARIASGGEMSRVMLALKTLLSGVDDIQTLVFDEIDTGVSGRTGQVVAENLAGLGRKRQVICVTHLPQIASMGETHFLIEKTFSESGTQVSLTRLDTSGRVREIARLVGGAEVTETTLRHAQEMLHFADEYRQRAS